ncbi:MAG: hypothetical protein ACP5JY_00505 [Candidatus Nanoarchaeia archaeon]
MNLAKVLAKVRLYFVVLYFLFYSISNLSYAETYFFKVNTPSNLSLENCDYAEWLLWSEQPIEKVVETDIQGLNFKNLSKSVLENSLSEKIEFAWERTDPIEKRSEQIKTIFRKNEIFVLGPTKIKCPGNFTIIIPKAGSYYVPLRLYTEQASKDISIGIVAEENVVKENKVENITFEPNNQNARKKQNLLLIISAFFICIGFGLLAFSSKFRVMFKSKQ